MCGDDDDDSISWESVCLFGCRVSRQSSVVAGCAFCERNVVRDVEGPTIRSFCPIVTDCMAFFGLVSVRHILNEDWGNTVSQLVSNNKYQSAELQEAPLENESGFCVDYQVCAL